MGDAVVIDVRGLKCPLPVLKTERRMRCFPPGTRFVVLTTDPLAAIDLPHFCAERGHRLIASAKDGSALRLVIEKG